MDGTRYNTTKFEMYPKEKLNFQLIRDKQQIPVTKNPRFYERQNKTETITKLQSESYRNVVDMQIRFHIKRLKVPLHHFSFFYIFSLFALRIVLLLIGLFTEGMNIVGSIK